MKRKIIIGASILLMIPFLLNLFLSLTRGSTFSTSFLVFALISVLGMIFTKKDKYMFSITFFMFIAASIGVFAEIMQYFT